MCLFNGAFILPGFMTLSSNKISGASHNNHLHEAHEIGYPKGWRAGETEKWYKSQPTTKFTHLQFRKEREAPSFHEYVVLELDNNTVCRFDCRDDVTTHAGILRTFTGNPPKVTVHVVQKQEDYYTHLDNNSDMLLRIHFPNGEDLLTVLAICYGLQKVKETGAYTLTRYNSYFFSWIIITATARRTVDWTLLSTDETKWEELVNTTIEGLSTERSSLGIPIKANARSVLGLGRKDDSGPSSGLDSLPFVSATYLISTLRKALFGTRASIQKSLGQQLFQASVEPAMRQIAFDAAVTAAGDAARNHAGQAARDAAMEVVIQPSWRTILASENGGQLWEDQCKATEEAAWKAASAAADVDEQDESPGVEGVPDKWEKAWDDAWVESQKQISIGQNRSIGQSDDDSNGGNISIRAKEAWYQAWVEACEANESYVPLFSKGVVDYVTKNLPDSSPEVLRFDMGTQSKIHAMVAAMSSEPKNSMLQEYIRTRISELCRRGRRAGFKQTPAEVEEALRRVWVETVKALGDGTA